ncbi:MAG TPA: hypothetical protein VJK48_05245 [Chlamydiales bacterium]|nr:hypothetical protein [Chlamydiales bacterium]
MLGQTFSFSDILTVLILALLEILLSADNAVVLALFVKGLPERLQKKALYIGFISAFFLRALALGLIAYLVHFFWFQLIGALYLIYLSLQYWFSKNKPSTFHVTPLSFKKTVMKIELFDLLFAMDSILAGVAFISSPSYPNGVHTSKLWIVYLGGMIGAFTIRYAASLLSLIAARFPRIESAAYGMIGWIGLKLILTSFSLTFPYFFPLFWLGLIIILLWGLYRR